MCVCMYVFQCTRRYLGTLEEGIRTHVSYMLHVELHVVINHLACLLGMEHESR